MSDKPSRTIEDIQLEYQKACTQAGHIQYQVYTFKRDLEALNQVIRDLNLEAAGIKAAEKPAEQPKESSDEKAAS